ncbi:MAG TPA: ribonuclease PH [Thermomicrobiales bacterium]|nr:ribonuclease PH [Thermomicrobiales bacterium]
MSVLNRVGRELDELRAVTIETGIAAHAEGSALIAFGDTRVWCTATVDERVPPWLEGGNRGWVTAEYSMLPRSTHTRNTRERAAGSGRSQEISRLIGRSLRAGVNLRGLGQRQIIVDCDVLQADGGTRTAAITGGFVALALACGGLVRQKALTASPIVSPVAAVSAGVIGSEVRLDLDYREDSSAAVDCNVVMNARGELIEVQCSAEGRTYSRTQLDRMVDLAAAGVARLIELQRAVIESG